MTKEECFILGQVTKTHSFKGDLVLFIDADDPEQYAGLEAIWLEISERLVPFFIDDCRPHNSPQKFVIHLEGVDDEDSAQALCSKPVFLPLSLMTPLGQNQFYLHEVNGWHVFDAEKNESIGQVHRVLEYPIYPILEVESEGNIVLIPLPDHVEIEVNREQQSLHLTLPEGLLDVYKNSGEPSDFDESEEAED